MLGNSEKVLVVIVTFNAMRWVERCLGSLQESTEAVTVMVIDNSSSDGTVEFIKEHFPQTELSAMSSNLGFAAANNIGMRHAVSSGYRYVFLLNQDTWIEPTTVSGLLGILRENPSIGILSPAQLTGNGNELDPNFSTYIKADTLGEMLQSAERNPLERTRFVNAAAWLLPSSAVKKIGGFDPLFPHYGEDRDYCYRAAYHGYEVAVALRTAICHDRIYAGNSPFRKLFNLTFTMGLAHVKNINSRLVCNYVSWTVWRLRKIIRAILTFDFQRLKAELRTMYRLVTMLGRIRASRRKSMFGESPFLS